VDPINARDWPRRFGISQLFGVHLVQAQPLQSILDLDYFLKIIQDCEVARKAKLERWRKLQHLVGNLAAMQQVLSALVGEAGCRLSEKSKLDVPKDESATYRPWNKSRSVRNSQVIPTFDDDEEMFERARLPSIELIV